MGVDLKLNKLTLNKNILLDILEEKLDKISEDTVNILKTEAPVDDTTKEKQKMYLAQGKRAWLMDNIESRKYWKLNRITRSSFGGGIKSSLTNPNPAVIALALGFISPLNVNAEPVERTKNGKFSEQSPKGRYALEAMAKSFKNNNVKYIKIKK
jgi:hypothetical protein